MLERRASTVAGLTVAVMGALPLLWLATAGSPQQPQPAVTIDAAAVPGLEAPPAEVTLEAPSPQIAGLSEAVSRVLVSRGFAGSEGVEQLPDSVAGVLANRGITLTIAGEGEG
jgi:hypothetical protein